MTPSQTQTRLARRRTMRWSWWCAVFAMACSHLTAMGQTTIELEQFGVGNSFRPGGPVGIKLKVTSDLDEVTTGVIQWEIENGDGDIAEYSRQLTIPFRGASTSIWLYGNLPPAPQASALMEENWTFRIFETSEGEKVREIANVRLAPQTAMNAPLALEMSADQILMIGPNLAGLQGYQPVAGFQGNPTLNNITITSRTTARQLPDSWEGLIPFSAIVWANAQSDYAPGELNGRRAIEDALREWIRRGGQLIILLPSSDDPWKLGREETTFGDLFAGIESTSREAVLLSSILPALSANDQLRIPDKKIGITTFDPNTLPNGWRPLAAITPWVEPDPEEVVAETGEETAAEKYARMAREKAEGLEGSDEPETHVWAIRRSFGLGTIDLVGIDASDPDLKVQQDGGLPQTGVFWRSILGRRATAPNAQTINALKVEDRLIKPRVISTNNLGAGALVSSQIGLGAAAAQGVLAAMGLFAVYWLVAGPGGFAVLRNFKLQKHAWLVFVATSIGFAVLAWVGSRVLRQEDFVIKHLTVLRHIYNAEESTTDNEPQFDIALSWFSAPLPGYGQVNVQISDEVEGTRNILEHFSPPPAGSSNRFPNSDRYEVPFDSRANYDFPARATSAEFLARYIGAPSSNAGAWARTISVSMDDPLTVERDPDTRSISLRGTLENNSGLDFQRVHLLHVYPLRTPAERNTSPTNPVPLVVDELPNYGIMLDLNNPWKAGDSLDLAQVMYPDGPRTERSRGRDSMNNAIRRSFVTPYIKGQAWGGMNTVGSFSEGDKYRYMSMLSLYHLLPPPQWLLNTPGQQPDTVRLHRLLGQEMDMSTHFSEPCLVVIAFTNDAPTPVPIEVNGREPGSSGRVMLQWIHPLPSTNIADDVNALAAGARWSRASSDTNSEGSQKTP